MGMVVPNMTTTSTVTPMVAPPGMLVLPPHFEHDNDEKSNTPDGDIFPTSQSARQHQPQQRQLSDRVKKSNADAQQQPTHQLTSLTRNRSRFFASPFRSSKASNVAPLMAATSRSQSIRRQQQEADSQRRRRRLDSDRSSGDLLNEMPGLFGPSGYQ
jgi:hypothetical protein